jgi:NADH-quinone oxidoreductase subunit M
MQSFAALLPFAILLPFAAMILHGAAPARGGRPGAEGVPDRNRAQARAALAFNWAYGAFLTVISVMAMASPHGLRIAGRAAPLGLTGFKVEPALYLDGRNAPFLLLLGLCLPLVFTWLRDKDGRYGPSYYVSANLLVLSLAGVFLSDSLLLFYLFWETALLGAYFWIGLHGRANIHSGSVYSALIRFFLFTLVGSLPMQVSIIALCAAAGGDPGINGILATASSLDGDRRAWIFAGFLLGFAVKLPLLGFHGWLRDTYNVAAPACRALLSGVMSKMGAYGLILVLAQGFPEECLRYAPQLQVLCVAGAVYGAMLCLAQDRLIDILVYSSLSHLSLLALGVFTAAGDTYSTGLSGAIFQVFNHGLIMAALFAFDARIGTGGESPALSATGGLRSGQRRLAAVLLTAIFASCSLPGMSNFAGEILVLFSAFRSSPWLTFLASIGALVGAAALVRGFHQVFLGRGKRQEMPGFTQAPDFSVGETGLGLALIALWVALGLYPMLFLRPVENTLLSPGAFRGMAFLP